MVKGMHVVREKSAKKEDVTYFYLEVDFGYRKMKIFDLSTDIYPELCGVTAEQLYSMPIGQKLPVKFDLPSLHNGK